MTTPSDPLAHLTADQQRALLAELLRKRAAGEGKVTSRPQAPLEAMQDDATPYRFPMSAGQQGLWYAFCRDPHATSFNVYLPTQFKASIDIDALRRAVNLLVERHRCLRTTFEDREGELLQTVHPQLEAEFQVHDVTELQATQGWEHLRAVVAKESQREFDLQRGPMLRMAVYRLAADDHVVLATTHHIVVDFWSLMLMLAELREIYPCLAVGKSLSLRPAVNNYDSFVDSQMLMLSGEEGRRHQAYWRKQLADVPTVFEMVTDFDRPAAFTGRAAVASLDLPSSLLNQVQKVALESRATPFAVVHAALQVSLARYTGQHDLVIGSPFSGRGHREFESTVGFFVNMLPIRAKLDGDPSFQELVRRTGQTLTEALEHESYPFSSIVHDIAPTRDPSRSPLFQVSCTYEKSQLRGELGRAGSLFPEEKQVNDFGGLRQESFYIPHQTCHYDLEFIFEQTDRELRGMICYCRDLFSEDTMQSMAENFVSLFMGLLENPLLSVFAGSPTCHSITTCHSIKGFSERLSHSEGQTVCRMLGDAISKNPDGVAIRSIDKHWTYAQLASCLNRGADEITTQIRLAREATFKRSGGSTMATLKGAESGSVPDANGRNELSLIPVIGPALPETFIAALAVMCSGAAVVPIDEEQPAVGREELQEDTCAPFVLESPRVGWYAEGRDSSEGTVKLCVPSCRPSDLAYVIYTSGTTGRPKGVMVEHRAICNTLKWRHQAVPLTSKDRVFMLFSHQFDAGFGIALAALTQGAEVVWGDSEARYDIGRLVDQLIRDRITVLPAIPSLLRLVVEHPRVSECRELRQLWAGGESMPRDLPNLVRSRTNATLWNFYGPTEAAVEAVAGQVDAHDGRRSVPLGFPIDGAEVFIVDDRLQPVANTVPGQLAIAGVGLARGYLRQPELTNQRFVTLKDDSTADVDAGLRVYLTGDRGRRLRDGRIEFLGRQDNQVKVRGYRLELEEIEVQLESHPMVAKAAVKVIAVDTPQVSLVAYVTLKVVQESERDQLAVSILRDLADRLPAYKVPAQVVVLESMPMTTSGKVDRKRLPEASPPSDESDCAVPRTPLEEFLAQAWCAALNVERVSIHQDFFALGGSSLQAAILTNKLTSALGVHVPTSLLFDLADISMLARRLAQLYEVQMAERFGMASVTAYAAGRATVGLGSAADEVDCATHPLIAPLKTSGERRPIFLVHPPGGIVMCYRELAARMDPSLPVYAIRSRGLHGHERLPASVEEAAADYIQALKTVQPRGPYRLGGWSVGGVFAFEMALQLNASGEHVDRLLLLDTALPERSLGLLPQEERVNVGLEYGVKYTLAELRDLHPDEQLPFLWEHAKSLGVLQDETPAEVVSQVLADLKQLFHHHLELATAYAPKWYDGTVSLIRPTEVPFELDVSEDRGWRCLARQVEVQYVAGHHHSMVQMPHVVALAKAVER
jgi:amino acid adenylation domain-containing protein